MAADIAIQAEDVAPLRERLTDELEQLKKEINVELAREDLSRYAAVIDAVRDRGEESVADLYADLELHFIERQVERLISVEAALQRIANNAFGICIECSLPITKARLEADPAVPRCLACQARVESVPTGKDPTPSL